MSPAGPRWDLEHRRLYLCTPDRRDLADFIEACIRGGVDIVQLRDKDLDARPLLRRAVIARQVCRDHGVPFVLNDRPDLALEADADGVHVGQDDAPPALARRLLGSDRIVGLSTHAPAELSAAGPEPIDYLSAGPVVPTPTKPGRPGTGADYVAEAAQATADWPSRSGPLPFFVTGGVTPESVGELVRAGATRFVVVRYLTGADDPEAAARRLRQAIERSLELA
ncbi:MAG: thiamine-phosphate pyrophosphorylase [Acidimicrobiaceae bacterium]|nr:thiamine-phosphate pyrophosphorylase [Acidimicrobiaceae bacterium]